MDEISSSLQEDEMEQEPTGRKRRRTVQACEECRDRKRKCDGVRPVCSSCSRKPGRCIWNDHRNTKGWSNNYVESLRSRIRELEAGSTAAPRERDQQTQAHQSDHATAAVEGNANTGVYDGDAVARHEIFEIDPNLDQISPASTTNNGLGSIFEMATPPLAAPSPSQAMRTSYRQDQGGPPTQSQQTPEIAARPEGPIADSPNGGLTDDESYDDAVFDSCDEGLDGMGIVHSAPNGGPGRTRRPSGYFGPSSTVGLLGDAFSAINKRGHRGWTSSASSLDSGIPESREGSFPRRSGQQNLPPPQSRERKASNPGRGYIIPTRNEADGLVESYQTWVYSLYPFLHMPSFLSRYRSIWTGSKDLRQANPVENPNPTNYYDTVSEKLFHCLLNLVFAMGALFNPAIAGPERDNVSQTFFARAKALIDLDELACGSTALVQVLLLMGQYLQSTDAASSCWNIVGLAIRVSQGIGLHHEPECCHGAVCSSDRHGQLDREIRRRTWMCSVILDRVLSLTYGRPMMIHPTMTRNRLCLPRPIDDEYLTSAGQAAGQQPPGVISIVGCYIEAIRLQDIIGQFLVGFNHVGLENGSDSKRQSDHASGWHEKAELDIKTFLEIDRRLDEWRQGLPHHLRIQTHKSSQPADLEQDPHRLIIIERQANVLATRFLHARLTLLRPALATLCKAPPEAEERVAYEYFNLRSVNQEMIIKAANQCLSTTEALVQFMTVENPQTDLLPAPWYNVFYIHSCAIVLLLGYLCNPTHITCMDKASLASSYRRCVSFIRANRPNSRSARQCSKVLTAIEQQVFRQQPGTDRPYGAINVVSTERNDAAADSRPDAFQSTARPELQTMIPLCDPSQSQDTMLPDLANIEMPYSSHIGWIGDTTDTTWLSLVPFWGDPQPNTMP